MSDQIKVAIKVRPLIEREQFEQQAWSVSDNTIFQIDPLTGKRKGDIYKFDHIFDTFSRNQDVFDTVVKPLVEAAVGGFNATVFAYGQTSSGKTYTMSGDETECGVIQMAISYMFEAMKQSSGREFLARASHLEIYNEKVKDLLGSSKTNLQIREVEGNVVVSDLKEELVADVSKTIELMKKGELKRRVGETAMNEKSSRSHSIFRIIIESRDTDEGDAGAIQVSQLNFVDLAGSERVNQTGAQGERLKEGCSINRSLFMLGHVISQLSEGQRTHINFRDSKLTRILQPSLGGNALTVIICTVTPAAIEETHCTLGFASRAKIIKNEPHLNEVLSDGTLLKRYARQLSKLKAELEEAKASNYAQEVEAMENKLEEKDKHNRLLQARIDLLTEKLISGVTTKDRKQAYKRRRTWCAPSARLSFLPFSLATIEEITSPCQKPINILESSLASQFQIPLEEFELQLLSAEVDSVSSEPPIIADVTQSPISSESTDNLIDTVLSCPHVTSRSRRKRDSELPIDQVRSPVGICDAGCQTDPIAV
ncbi:uncharacterized protein [Anabrus simplex]|uniref:uncharacterized protein n=1 Tax=Anabrus simplex TaxID=316456 RepID=UPI0035A2D48A